MLISFVGDVHGRVFHMLLALVTWHRQSAGQLDAIIQVGDMGAFPDVEAMDDASRTYLALDETEGDFARLLHAEGHLADSLVELRAELEGPIHFIHGNHDDVSWLESLHRPESSWVDVDRFGFLRHVRDGTVLSLAGARVAFLGGEGRSGAGDGLNAPAYDPLMELGPEGYDI